jgi:hypothetical protein
LGDLFLKNATGLWWQPNAIAKILPHKSPGQQFAIQFFFEILRKPRQHARSL